jgi:hypothetical protein
MGSKILSGAAEVKSCHDVEDRNEQAEAEALYIV